MPQNPHKIPKIRLVLEHTIANRAVFYCIYHEAADAKSANSGLRNRVTVRDPKTPGAHSNDIEPPAKVPYINGLAEHSMNHPVIPAQAGIQLLAARPLDSRIRGNDTI
jgi:hypothetical protein